MEAPRRSNSSHDEKDRSDVESFSTNFTESTDVPRRQLGFVQVSSMMINQMIGTGIFTAPAYVLLLTQSKPLGLGLWALGGVYTFLSASVYLEFANAFPFNGGPLIWLDETFHRPALLVSIIFSIFWIFFATSGNSGSFATYIVQLMYPDANADELDQRLINILQVVAQGAVCLALYFVRPLCFMLNNLFAIFKVVLLFAFAVAGFIVSRQANSGTSDFNRGVSTWSSIDALAAMIYIIFTYEGWEYTNYIAGEITAPKETLRKAMFFSIGIVTALYMLVTCAYYTALTYNTIQAPANAFGVAGIFAQKAFGSTTGIGAAMAISALSNTMAITYAESKVMQAIAWQSFMPFSKFVGRQSRHFNSPGGALLLHWIISILVLLAYPTTNDASSFANGTFDYGYEFMMAFLGIGLFRLRGRMRALNEEWRPAYLTTNYSLYLVGVAFIGLNILMLVVTAYPHLPGAISRFWWAVEVVAIITVGVGYWAGLKALQGKIGRIIGFQVEIHESRDDDIPESLRALMSQAVADGSNRRVFYKISGITAYILDKCRTCYHFVAKILG